MRFTSIIVRCLIILIVFPISLIAQNNFYLKGNISSVPDNTEIRLSFENSSLPILHARVKEGVFNFSGSISQPYEYAYLTINYLGDEVGGCGFFIHPGDMKISLPVAKNQLIENKINYEGIHFIKEQKEFQTLIKPIEDSLAAAFNLFTSIKHGYLSGNADSLTAIVRLLKKEKLKRKLNFIQKNSNYFGLYIFSRDILNYIDASNIAPDSLMQIYSRFDADVKSSPLGKITVSSIIKKQSLVLNKVMPELSFTTNDGRRYRLSSFLGKKFVLLCFWDSWCGPCIRNIPLLNEFKNEYQTKGLQIISISLDTDLEKWYGSLQKYKMPWLQTCDVPQLIKGTRVRSLYDINYIPQYFLINKEGLLIYHNTQMNDTDDYFILKQILEQSLH